MVSHGSLGRVVILAVMVGACAELPVVSGDAGGAGVDGGGRDGKRPVVVSLSAAETHVCAVDGDGGVWCWGANVHGQAAPEVSDSVVSRPTRVRGVEAVEVVAGWGETCARDRQGRVKCWGFVGGNRSGVTEVQGLVDARQMALSEGLGCAVRQGGGLLCWSGAVADSVERLEGVTMARAGREAVCALRTDGTVWCFGRNDVGQRGSTVAADAGGVSAVEGLTDVRSLTMGDAHGCAVDAMGTLWGWGHNAHGQLMQANVHDAFRARPSGQVKGVAYVSAGGEATFVKLQDGRWMVSGANDSEQLQLTDVEEQVLPRVTLDAIGAEVVSLAVGENFACGLMNDHSVRCWGSNVYGAIGSDVVRETTARPTEPRW